MTRDIFAERRGRRREWQKALARSAGVGAMWLGRGVVRLGKHAIRLSRFSARQMQPMRWRDWATVVALVVVFIAMGTYMAIQERDGMVTQRQGCRWHVVEAGDTLISLARESGLSVGEIARANGVYDVKDPPVGQDLCIPSTSDVAQAASVVSPASHTDGPVIQGQTAYVRFALPFARRAHEATGWPVSVILAQWGLEQGWQTPTFTGYNFGNCGGLQDEPFIPGTSAPGSPSTFAYADTPEDGLRFYIHVAQLPYYDQIVLAARQGGPVAAAKALGASPWDAHHYTDHNDPGSSLVALMQQYNLQQYD
ncbi:MAG TPA: LysM peptidoglycan-binding domain-containing protein [Ktedonobacterales bacterium]